MNYSGLTTIQRAFSILFAFTFTTSQVVLGSVVETNIWTTRQEQLKTKNVNPLNQLPKIQPTLSQSITGKVKNQQNPSAWPKDFQTLINQISPQHGYLRDIHYSGFQNKPAVVLIQDVHLNPEAQNNIASLLQNLINANILNRVGVEGAFGPDEFEQLRQLPHQRILNEKAQHFLDQNLIAAPTFVGVTSPIKPPPFFGMDDKDHYTANVKAYLDSKENHVQIENELNQFQITLTQDKQKYFNEDLLHFDELRSAYNQGQIDLGIYLKNVIARANGPRQSITGVSDSRWPRRGAPRNDKLMIEQFLAAYHLEKNMDLNQVEKERRQIFEKLSTHLSEQELKILINESLAYKTGDMSFGSYYMNLKALCEQKGVSLRQAPAFDEYIRYVLLSDGIHVDQLFDEIEQFENQTIEYLTQTAEEKELIDKSTWLQLTQKLVKFELTPKEWGKYQLLPGFLDALMPRNNQTARQPGSLAAYIHFYEQADIRSQKMVENLFSRDAEPGTRNVAMVTGGFHTPEIAQKLRENKFSYIVVQPKITKVTELNGSAYLSIFDQEKKPLKNIFSGTKLFVSPASVYSVGFRDAPPESHAILNQLMEQHAPAPTKNWRTKLWSSMARWFVSEENIEDDKPQISDATLARIKTLTQDAIDQTRLSNQTPNDSSNSISLETEISHYPIAQRMILFQKMAEEFNIKLPTNNNLDFNEVQRNIELLGRIVSFATFSRLFFDFYRYSDPRIPPLQYAIQNKIYFRLGNNMYITPVSASFRRHIIFHATDSQLNNNQHGKAIEIKVPGVLAHKRSISFKSFQVAEFLSNVYKDSPITEKPISFLSIGKSHSLYGGEYQTLDGEDPAVYLVEYEIDANRLDSARVPEDQRFKVALQYIALIAKVHAAGYSMGADSNLGNFRVWEDEQGEYRVALAGDFNTYRNEYFEGILKAESNAAINFIGSAFYLDETQKEKLHALYAGISKSPIIPMSEVTRFPAASILDPILKRWKRMVQKISEGHTGAFDIGLDSIFGPLMRHALKEANHNHRVNVINFSGPFEKNWEQIKEIEWAKYKDQNILLIISNKSDRTDIRIIYDSAETIQNQIRNILSGQIGHAQFKFLLDYTIDHKKKAISLHNITNQLQGTKLGSETFARWVNLLEEDYSGWAFFTIPINPRVAHWMRKYFQGEATPYNAVREYFYADILDRNNVFKGTVGARAPGLMTLAFTIVGAPVWETFAFPYMGHILGGLAGWGWATLGFAFAHTIVEWWVRSQDPTYNLSNKQIAYNFFFHFSISFLYLLPYFYFQSPVVATAVAIVLHAAYNTASIILTNTFPRTQKYFPLSNIFKGQHNDESEVQYLNAQKNIGLILNVLGLDDPNIFESMVTQEKTVNNFRIKTIDIARAPPNISEKINILPQELSRDAHLFRFVYDGPDLIAIIPIPGPMSSKDAMDELSARANLMASETRKNHIRYFNLIKYYPFENQREQKDLEGKFKKFLKNIDFDFIATEIDEFEYGIVRFFIDPITENISPGSPDARQFRAAPFTDNRNFVQIDVPKLPTVYAPLYLADSRYLESVIQYSRFYELHHKYLGQVKKWPGGNKLLVIGAGTGQDLLGIYFGWLKKNGLSFQDAINNPDLQPEITVREINPFAIAGLKDLSERIGLKKIIIEQQSGAPDEGQYDLIIWNMPRASHFVHPIEGRLQNYHDGGQQAIDVLYDLAKKLPTLMTRNGFGILWNNVELDGIPLEDILSQNGRMHVTSAQKLFQDNQNNDVFYITPPETEPEESVQNFLKAEAEDLQDRLSTIVEGTELDLGVRHLSPEQKLERYADISERFSSQLNNQPENNKTWANQFWKLITQEQSSQARFAGAYGAWLRDNKYNPSDIPVHIINGANEIASLERARTTLEGATDKSELIYIVESNDLKKYLQKVKTKARVLIMTKEESPTFSQLKTVSEQNKFLRTTEFEQRHFRFIFSKSEKDFIRQFMAGEDLQSDRFKFYLILLEAINPLVVESDFNGMENIIKKVELFGKQA